MTRPPLDVREWLEDMRRFNSRDADRATELLAVLDAAENGENELVSISEAIGDFDEARKSLEAFASLEEWAEDDDFVKDLDGETTEQRLQSAVKLAKKYEAQSFALSELCMAAGIIAKNDYGTDPLPLLAMFLPVD